MANGKSKEEVYEVESKKFTRYHEILEWLFLALLLVGIVTAALDVTIGGFTPLIWFVLSFGVILVIACMEVSMIRAFLESRKQK
jgi:membrane protein YdbS with pleckstrin-like domain